MGLVGQQKRHLLLAVTCLVLCTASNLAAPVLSGMLLDCLVQQQPMERYMQVRLPVPLRRSPPPVRRRPAGRHGWCSGGDRGPCRTTRPPGC